MTSPSKLNEAETLEVIEQSRRLKHTLKQLSKNQLIQLLIEQVNNTIEQQSVNKILLEKLKENESAK